MLMYANVWVKTRLYSFTVKIIGIKIRLQLHYAIYRLRFYSELLIRVYMLSISYNDISWIQKNRPDKSHCLEPALERVQPQISIISLCNSYHNYYLV